MSNKYDQEAVIEILVRRDQLSPELAREMIKQARLEVAEGRDPEEVLYEDFGLEPDYIWVLI